jgi:hypothetical protein
VTGARDRVTKPSSRRRDVALAVAAAAEAISGVRLTTGGSAVEVSTLYPGGRVAGVSLSDDAVLICVALSRLPVPSVVSEIEAATRAALKALHDPRSVEVVVDDIDVDHLPPLDDPSPLPN